VPSIWSEWLKVKRLTTRSGKARRSVACIGLWWQTVVTPERRFFSAPTQSLWVVDLAIADQPDRTTEEHERAQVLGAVTLDSGGLTRTVISTQSIDPAFTSMAAVLTSRYLVTYARPEQTIPPSTVVVTSKRSDVRLTSSRWPR